MSEIDWSMKHGNMLDKLEKLDERTTFYWKKF